MKAILLAFLLIQFSLQQSCSTLNIQLTPSTGESYQWDLSQLFGSGASDYKLNDTSEFELVQPFNQTDNAVAVGTSAQAQSLIKSAAHVTEGLLTQSYAYIGRQGGKLRLSWAHGVSSEPRTSPKFAEGLDITLQANEECFDVSFVNRTHVILDCFDTLSLTNTYYLATLDSSVLPTRGEVPNYVGLTEVGDRINQWITLDSITGPIQYVFRGVPYDKSPQSALGNQTIEVLYLNEKDQLAHTGFFLDGATIAAVTGSNDTSFFLVDFKVSADGFLFVLDTTTKLVKLQFQANGIWVSHGSVSVPNTRSFGFDLVTYYDISTQSDVAKVSVQFFDYVVTYKWPSTSNTPSSSTLKKLPFKTYSSGGIFRSSSQYTFAEDVSNQLFYVFNNNQQVSFPFPAGTQLFVNQDFNLAYTLSLAAAQAWSFSTGALVLKANPKQVTQKASVIQANVGGQTCQVVLNYTVYDAGDANVYVTGPVANPLPGVVVYPNVASAQLNQQVSGPNIHYNVAIPKSTTEEGFLQYEATQTTNLTIFDNFTLNTTSQLPKDLVFTKLVAADNLSQGYIQFFQTSDNNLQAWYCYSSDSTSVPNTCQVVLKSTNFNNVLTPQTFQVEKTDYSTVVYVQTDDFTIQVHKHILTTQSLSLLYTVSNPPRPGNQISSFGFSAEYIWIVYQQQNALEVVARDNQTRTRITVQDLTDLGFTGTFKPLRVFTNYQKSPHVVVIHNTDSLLVVDYTGNQLNLYKVIPLGGPISQVEVGLSDSTFFVAYTNGKSYLWEFNYDDVSNVYLQKQINLYWYEFQNVLQAETSTETGHFLLRVLCTKCLKTFVLAYQPNVLGRLSLWRAVSTGELINTNQSMVFSGSAKDQLHLFIKTTPKNVAMTFFTNPYLQVQQGLNGNAQVQANTIQFSYISLNSTFTFKQDYKVLNTNTDITVNATKNSNFFIRFNSTNITMRYAINESSFNGQVLQYSINCSSCHDQVSVANHLEATNNTVDFSAASDFAPLGQELLAQTSNQIWFTLNNSLSRPYVTLDNPSDDFKCSLISPSDDNSYLISLCADSTNVYAYITSCVAEHECFPAEYIILPGVTKASKFAVLDTHIFVMNTNWQNPNEFEGSVIAFRLTLEDDDWKAIKVAEMGSAFFNQKVYITDFDMTNVGGNNYKFYLTEASTGLWTIDASVVNGTLNVSSQIPLLSTVDYLTKQGEIIADNTQFVSSKILQSSNYSQTVLLTTSNVNHYVFTLTYDPNRTLTNQSIAYTLQRHSWPTLNKLRVHGSTIILTYATNSSMVLFVTYHLPTTLQSLGAPTQVSISGGAIHEYVNSKIDNLATTFAPGTDQFYFNGPSSYQLNENASIQIVNGSKLSSQKIKLIASNTNGQFETEFDLYNADQLEDDEGWKWWYTLLIVLGVILVVAIIGYAVVKSRKGQGGNVGDYERLSGDKGHVQRPQASV